MITADIGVIGAGIAGASLAAELSGHADVVLIEGEDQPGYHATGRSAAFWTETYGGSGVQPLTSASGSFLSAPPPGFSERGFLSRRGAVHLARSAAKAKLEVFRRAFPTVVLDRLDAAELRARVHGLKPGWTNGIAEAACSDIDVAALHAAYLAAFRRNGGRLLTGARTTGIARDGAWRVTAGGEAIACATIVNAAGAWADDVARLAGAAPLGIRPYRRTIVQLRVDPAVPADLPLVIDIEGGFYFKGVSGGRIWLSPHDETLCAPGDVTAEEIDIALAVHRMSQVVDWRVERVERAWAGLRSFAPDRLPVYGYDSDTEGFFWFAGQGGSGIQTAPAAAKLAAGLVLGTSPDPMVSEIDAGSYAPGRLRQPSPANAGEDKGFSAAPS